MQEPSPLALAQQQLLRREYSQSLRGFLIATKEHPENSSAWLGAAQAARYLGQIADARVYVDRAVQLNRSDASVHAVYSTFLRADGDATAAAQQLARALELDEDFAEAFNSLADLQRESGDLEKALQNYDAGVRAIARRIVKSLRNDESNPIVKHTDMRGHVWFECAMFGSVWLSSTDGIGKVAWPTNDSASEEERSERHRGLYFFDHKKWFSVTRVFLPNYFATFRERLRSEPVFEFLVGNQGAIHKLRGDDDLAQKHFEEADIFSTR